jgi:hypothetical protein
LTTLGFGLGQEQQELWEQKEWKCLDQQRGSVDSAVLAALSGGDSEPSEEDGTHSGHSYRWRFDATAFPIEDTTLALQGVGIEKSPTAPQPTPVPSWRLI